jgi:peptidoglycan glycosyltransferase
VILNPTDGAILVLYSSPGYDPNNLNPTLFARKDSQARLLNRALQGLYPAGSAFKVLVAAAALEKGMDPRFDCPAEGYRAGVASQPIRDHEYYEYRRKGKTWPGHGTLGMREALAKSSNVYFARLGVQVGGPALRAATVRCGITRSWTLLEGSSGKLACLAGNVPPLSDRDLAKTAQISIGQGDLLVTPLHMAVLAGAIGQGGTLCPPRLSATAPVKPPDRVFPPQVARTLTAMMRQVVTHGTGRGADIAGLDVAGKTGTAQNPHGADHGWFIGFAPADNPVLAFAVIVEAGGFGSQSALPVAAGLLRKAQALGLFDPPSRQEVPR